MPSLKVVTLNVGRGLHGMDKPLAFLAGGQWDIACIQDLRETHIPALAEIFPGAGYFAPMTRHFLDGARVSVGIAIFSKRLPFLSASVHAYAGNFLPLLALDGVEDDSDEKGQPRDLAIMRATESRLALFVEVEAEGLSFKIGTTHGTWGPGGKTDDYQRRTMRRLALIARCQGNLVMAGDFNAPRDGEIYKILTAEMTDRIPPEVKNSLDPVSHRLKGAVEVLADYFFIRGNYTVSEVGLTFGVSDHGALSATVSRV